jgi:hypothetical protein
MINVLPTEPQHLVDLAADIRAEDRIESLLWSRVNLKNAMQNAVGASRESFTVLVDGKVACVFGVADMPGNPSLGVVWLRAANRINQCLLYVMRQTPLWLTAWHAQYPGGLVAYPMAENNDLHLRWLRAVGFRVRKTIYAIDRTPFLEMIHV